MPTSEKQIEANKRNAKKSTGPKTKQGKTASSLNAVKYGLFTENIIINSPYLKEDPEQYQQLVDSLIEDLQPESSIQKHLVLKIANCLWRSNRALAAETAEIKAQLAQIDDDLKWKYYFKIKQLQETNEDFDPQADEIFTREELDNLLSIMAGQRSIPDQSANNNILHYQMRLDRQIANAYRLLANLKQSRKRNRRNEKRQKADDSETKNQQNEPILNSRSKLCGADVPVCPYRAQCEQEQDPSPRCQEPLPDSKGSSSDEGSDTPSQAQPEFEPATRPSPTNEEPAPWENDVQGEDDEKNNGGRRLIHQTRAAAKGQRRITTDEEARQSMSELKGIYDIFTD